MKEETKQEFRPGYPIYALNYFLNQVLEDGG